MTPAGVPVSALAQRKGNLLVRATRRVYRWAVLPVRL